MSVIKRKQKQSKWKERERFYFAKTKNILCDIKENQIKKDIGK